MQKLNIAEYCLKSHAEQFPDKNALILVDKLGSEDQITYQALYCAVCGLAASFKQFHLPKGSVVCIYAADTYDLLLIFLAAIAADLVPVMMLLSLVDDGINFIFLYRVVRAHPKVCYTHNMRFSVVIPV